MSEQDNMSYRLLAILQEYAPTGNEQQTAADFYNSRKMDCNERGLAASIAQAIHNGLLYNNWPWTTFPRPTTKDKS